MLLPPAQCILCGQAARSGLCPACQQDLPWLNQAVCPRCAMPSALPADCPQCQHNPPAFNQTVAAFSYEGWLARCIPAGKFSGRWSLFTLLAQTSAHRFEGVARPDYLVPVPLHGARWRERGFNQSALLAQIWGRHLQVPLSAGWLDRVRDTGHQLRLDLDARQRNMRRAFVTTPTVAGTHIALVDDVMTSGATLHVAARTLLRAGVRRVDAWVLARTL
ncbi:ComF family protein [Silvimonas terrae]|uniref:ComF family protein n=1 Tax=Silvimonas terrae TaxID=300266 RepID=A0A840RM91_9NEIS|nr:ComF family protein [Silvimonas terrae]MBB5193610.1 ComF family protein [Silvimonas terrae]